MPMYPMYKKTKMVASLVHCAPEYQVLSRGAPSTEHREAAAKRPPRQLRRMARQANSPPPPHEQDAGLYARPLQEPRI